MHQNYITTYLMLRMDESVALRKEGILKADLKLSNHLSRISGFLKNQIIVYLLVFIYVSLSMYL
jgi:hypothetical protein